MDCGTVEVQWSPFGILSEMNKQIGVRRRHDPIRSVVSQRYPLLELPDSSTIPQCTDHLYHQKP